MQMYDLAMMAVVLGAALWGFFKGMARQVASLTSLVASYFVALKASPLVAPYIGQPEPLARYIAMLALYLLTSLAVWLVFRRVSQIIERVELKDFDRQVGGLFGAAKGVVLCVAITFFTIALWPQGRETVLKSRSGYYIVRLMHQSEAMMPKELHTMLESRLREFERQLARVQAAQGATRLRVQRTKPER
jgi:membrane protein required for colicin V production